MIYLATYPDSLIYLGTYIAVLILMIYLGTYVGSLNINDLPRHLTRQFELPITRHLHCSLNINDLLWYLPRH